MYKTLAEVKLKIESLSKTNLKTFNMALIPGEKVVYGLKMQEIRDIAKNIERPLEFLKVNDYSSYELKQISACLIGKLDNFKDAIKAFESFISVVDSWALCDNLCQSFKITTKHKTEVIKLLRRYYKSEKEFEVRVVAVMLMTYYLDDDYIDEVLEVYDNLYLKDYYAKMAVAWGLATAMAKQREKTYAYLLDNHLDDWTYNKAITKMLESYRISDEDKVILRKMKRG